MISRYREGSSKYKFYPQATAIQSIINLNINNIYCSQISKHVYRLYNKYLRIEKKVVM